MRGRLLNTVTADLRRLDVAATAADPDLVVDSHGHVVSDGPLVSGYDNTFRAPVRIPDGSYRGKKARVEAAPLLLRCQFEVAQLNALGMLASGWMTENDCGCLLHLRDVERAGLITALGDSTLWLGTRLDALYDLRRNLVQRWVDPPGMYCVKSEPGAFGEIGFSRDLLLLRFTPREQGKKG